jgi:hypothetical protein
VSCTSPATSTLDAGGKPICAYVRSDGAILLAHYFPGTYNAQYDPRVAQITSKTGGSAAPPDWAPDLVSNSGHLAMARFNPGGGHELVMQCGRSATKPSATFDSGVLFETWDLGTKGTYGAQGIPGWGALGAVGAAGGRNDLGMCGMGADATTGGIAYCEGPAVPGSFANHLASYGSGADPSKLYVGCAGGGCYGASCDLHVLVWLVTSLDGGKKKDGGGGSDSGQCIPLSQLGCSDNSDCCSPAICFDDPNQAIQNGCCLTEQNTGCAQQTDCCQASSVTVNCNGGTCCNAQSQSCADDFDCCGSLTCDPASGTCKAPGDGGGADGAGGDGSAGGDGGGAGDGGGLDGAGDGAALDGAGVGDGAAAGADSGSDGAACLPPQSSCPGGGGCCPPYSCSTLSGTNVSYCCEPFGSQCKTYADCCGWSSQGTELGGKCTQGRCCVAPTAFANALCTDATGSPHPEACCAGLTCTQTGGSLYYCCAAAGAPCADPGGTGDPECCSGTCQLNGFCK